MPRCLLGQQLQRLKLQLSHGDDDPEADAIDADTKSDDDEAKVTAFGNELLADKDDVLNIGEESECSQFGVIESGDEAEKDDIETGEYNSSDDMD
ncbi:hypothetical protein PHMEG_00039710, partial [Phytophthora megakarya]